MSAQIDDSIESFYRQVRFAQKHTEIAFKLFEKIVKDEKILTPTFTLYNFTNYVYYYYMEVQNYENNVAAVYNGLIYRIHKKLEIKGARVRDVFNTANDIATKETSSLPVPHPIIEDVIEEGKVPLTRISFGSEMTLDVPTEIFLRLSTGSFTVRNFLAALLRYQLLGRNRGLFWSIDNQLYQSFPQLDKDTTPLETIECFASPFNQNLTYWCSAFEEDRIYGSRGNFFKVIKEIKGPKRFILNPPYTVYIVSDSIRVTLDYMERNPGCELIAMLPYQSDLKEMDSIKMLESMPNKWMLVLNPPSYTIHDFSTREDLRIAMSVYFFVSIGNSTDKSKAYANRCRDFLADKASRISKTSGEQEPDFLPMVIMTEKEAGPLFYR